MTTPEPTAAEERARIVAKLDREIEEMRAALDPGEKEYTRMRAIMSNKIGMRRAITTGQHWGMGE